jgi:hypothetical protein
MDLSLYSFFSLLVAFYFSKIITLFIVGGFASPGAGLGRVAFHTLSDIRWKRQANYLDVELDGEIGALVVLYDKYQSIVNH